MPGSPSPTATRVAGVVRGHRHGEGDGIPLRRRRRLVFRDGTPDVIAWPTDRAAWGRLCRLLTLGNRRAEKGDCHLDLPDLLAWGEGMMLGVMPASDSAVCRLRSGKLIPLSRSFPRKRESRVSILNVWR